MTFGGILARALLGDSLFADGANPNQAIPQLFIATLPAWAAAFICAGVLAAVMSTADGLVVSTAQIFANDIYRRTIAPRVSSNLSANRIDSISLLISRVATVLILIIAILIASYARNTNIALLVWIGVGGMMAATAAPMFLGVLWRRATKAGALVGFIVGGSVFPIIYAKLIKPEWFSGSEIMFQYVNWLSNQASNPFACATIASLISLFSMVVVSFMTKPPSKEHLQRVFGASY